MKTKIHCNLQMLKRRFIFTYLITLALLLLVPVMTAEAKGYYCKMTISAPATGGKIQLLQDGSGDITDLSKYVTSKLEKDVTSTQGGSVLFNLGAVPASRGYKFTGWTNRSNCTIVSGTTSSSQIQVKVTAPDNMWGQFLDQRTSASIKANFAEDNDRVTITYLSASNGSYTAVGPDGYGTVTIGNGSTYTTYSGDAITLTATPDPGYTFIRYYTIDETGNVTTLGDLYKTKQIVNITGSGNVSVCADFAAHPFAIGERTFETLDAATQAVKTTTSKTILLIKNATVPAGNYTIPADVTLLIPRDNNQTSQLYTTVEHSNATTAATGAFRILTLADGVNLQVNGAIELGGKQAAGRQGAYGAGMPTGTYGQMIMNAGSKITLNNGAKLYAWGFVTGDGEIDVRKGAKVYEQFQIYDWKGGSFAAKMIDNDQKVFPVSQYFIQNVEAAATYHPGAELICGTSINVSNIIIACDVIKIIGTLGSGAMFLMDEAAPSEDTWVRKKYDIANDKQVYEVNSSAHLGNMIIPFDMSKFDAGTKLILLLAGIGDNFNFDSRNYALPINNNMKIHLLDGEMGITQSTVMLPGSEIEIDKTSTVTINSGQKLYVYDSDQWLPYVMGGAYAQQILYSPTFNGKPNKRSYAGSSTVKPGDAIINVHGTFDVQGSIFTTTTGANIYSFISDAGTIYFANAVPASSTEKVYQWHQTGNDTYEYVPSEESASNCTSAKLKNDAGSVYSGGDGFSETAGTAAGQSFCFIDIDSDGKGEWVNLTTDGCFVYDQNGVYYAKPADYVALKNGKTENADHTYSSADGSRTLILISGECQWWEVEYQEESGLYFCEKNGIYYYYDEEEEWIPKTFKITWQNWDGSILKDEDGFNIIYEVPYGSMPKYNNSTPTRPADEGYYTYNFTGSWLPEFTPVTKDVTYVAQYEKNPVMYTIRWLNANGSEREVGYFQRDEMPVCRTQPADMSTLEWTPAVSAVTGDAIYQLKEKNVNGPFDIKFFNWNGVQIGTTQSIEKDAMPILPADPEQPNNAETNPYPVKPAIDDVEFIFTGWSPEVVAATENASYTAKFEEQPITYTITWKNWNGTILKTDEVAPKVVPQYTGTTPTKPAVGETEFVFASEWTPAIVAAADDATYTAVFNQKITGLNVTYARTIADEKEVSDVRITPAGSLTITGSITAQNFYLQATETESGQFLNGENKLTVNGNVYFDLTLNTPARHWHAFGVPWRVNINDNPLKEVETGRTLVLGRDYDIIYYNGTKRASQGPGAHCWEYVEDNGKTLTPGQGYMIAFTSAVQTVRFTKAAGAPVIFNGSNSVIGGSGDDGGWNAIANPMAYHATLNAGPTVGYVHDGGEIGSDGYVPYDIENKKYIVGKAVYVQASAPATVAVAAAGNKGVITPVAAPARRAKATDKTYLSLEDYYRVSLADAAGKSGSVYVLPEEDKADQYVIGHDLSQFGMNATKPQVWVNRYGTKLALNTTAPIDGVAEFPVSLYAPKDGEYAISLQPSVVSEQESETLYLTKDGEVIWNLSDGACTLTLAKGTAANYGLRIGEKKAPEVATGFGEAVVDAHGKTTKVLIDGKVFIIREDRVYTIDGQLVK